MLEVLQEDARITMRDLGQRVGLSGPAAAERMRRLEEQGVIVGYHAEVRPEGVGRSVVAFVRIALRDHVRMAQFERRMEELPAVLECHHLIGEDCYLVKVAVPAVPDLEQLLDTLAELGRTTTTLVLSSPIRGRAVMPIETTDPARANGLAHRSR
jgi:Lrp/AsnC family transcriptional regulator, leucine-responsive regulatory protein